MNTSSSSGNGCPPKWTSAAQPATRLAQYREEILAPNGVYIIDVDAEISTKLKNLAESLIRGGTTPSPPTSDGFVEGDGIVALTGDVARAAKYFIDKLGWDIPGLIHHEEFPVYRQLLPNNPATGSENKLEQPVPGILYGYSREALRDAIVCTTKEELLTDLDANSKDLLLPFFAVEFEPQTVGQQSNLDAAVNRAAGAGSACVKLAEDTIRARAPKDHPQFFDALTPTAFSAVMSKSEARLYVHSKVEQKYQMQLLTKYTLSQVDGYNDFHRAVRNILQWGGSKRLMNIRLGINMSNFMTTGWTTVSLGPLP